MADLEALVRHADVLKHRKARTDRKDLRPAWQPKRSYALLDDLQLKAGTQRRALALAFALADVTSISDNKGVAAVVEAARRGAAEADRKSDLLLGARAYPTLTRDAVHALQAERTEAERAILENGQIKALPALAQRAERAYAHFTAAAAAPVPTPSDLAHPVERGRVAPAGTAGRDSVKTAARVVRKRVRRAT
jgi:hypothetical protein